HNASFDVGFLNEELRRIGRPKFPGFVPKITDSLLMAREMFPGKSNSLDALCRRLEVDNSSRALHGALLDAGLLAEVYVRMTRGQESLVIDVGDGPEREAMPAVFDFSIFELITVAPDDEDLAAHEALLLDLDKASG